MTIIVTSFNIIETNMTIEILQQANKLNDELRKLKKQKEDLEKVHADELYYGSQIHHYYTLLPQEICCKVKNLILESLQDNINRKTKQLEEL